MIKLIVSINSFEQPGCYSGFYLWRWSASHDQPPRLKRPSSRTKSQQKSLKLRPLLQLLFGEREDNNDDGREGGTAKRQWRAQARHPESLLSPRWPSMMLEQSLSFQNKLYLLYFQSKHSRETQRKMWEDPGDREISQTLYHSARNSICKAGELGCDSSCTKSASSSTISAICRHWNLQDRSPHNKGKVYMKSSQFWWVTKSHLNSWQTTAEWRLGGRWVSPRVSVTLPVDGQPSTRGVHRYPMMNLWKCWEVRGKHN